MKEPIRSEQIQKSCKIIQREINKLNKLNCNIDLAVHTLTCFDNTVPAEKVKRTPDGDNLDFTNQVVFKFNQ